MHFIFKKKQLCIHHSLISCRHPSGNAFNSSDTDGGARRTSDPSPAIPIEGKHLAAFRGISQFPQQAGTSAILRRRKALPPFPTCTERDNSSRFFLSAMISFAWICTAVEQKKAESKSAKLTRDPLAKTDRSVL